MCTHVGDASKRYLSKRCRTRFVSRTVVHKAMPQMKEVNNLIEEPGVRRQRSLFLDVCTLKMRAYYSKPMYKPMKIDHRRWIIISSIQKRIFEMEAIITADSLLPLHKIPQRLVQTFNDRSDSFFYVEEKWLEIIEQTEKPHVKWLLSVLEESNLQDLFCAAVGEFFLFESPRVIFQIPPLTEFKPEELKNALWSRPKFGVDCDVNFGLRCVTCVLMRTP